jgi:flagellar assembly protein FliH
MTYNALKLEDFATPSPSNAATVAAADAEAIRLEAYEAGYKSGWDDANSETAASDHRIAADLERNLTDLRFTYEEARAEVLHGMSGLVSSILTSFLPRLAAEAVLPRVAEELQAQIASASPETCRIQAAPDTCKQIEWLVDTYMEMDLQTTPEPAFPDGRVTLHFSSETKEIDLSGLLGSVTEAIHDFIRSAQPEQELRHG